MAVEDSSDPQGTVIFDDKVAVVLGPQEAAFERERGSLLFLPHAAVCPAAHKSTPTRMPDNVRRFLDEWEARRRANKR